MLQKRLEQVQARIEKAAARAGRDPESVTLIAVTKKFPIGVIRESYLLGLRNFGENYVQEFAGKYPELDDLIDARFHLIGNLQTNKAKKASELFQVIQTVDSPKVARRLGDSGAPLELMIEVKLSGEETKSGAAPDQIAAILEATLPYSSLTLSGLMTIPPWSEKAEDSRPYFARLRQIAESHGLKELSMGMSNDLEVAIEEGATSVRVGTALFGPRKVSREPKDPRGPE